MDEKPAAAAGTHASGCFVCATAIPFMKSLWPQDTSKHFRNARVEFLKGVRTLVDHQIERLCPQEPKGTHVTVE